MRSMRWRAVFIATGAVLLMLVVPAVAAACNYPKISLGRTQAETGATVPFTIINAQPGSAYTVTVDGHGVASGTSSSAAGHSSSFVMPNLGAPQRVAVELTVTHNGAVTETGHESGTSVYHDSKAMDFVVAPSVSSGSAPAPPQAQPPAVVKTPTAAKSTGTASAQAGSTGSGSGHHGNGSSRSGSTSSSSAPSTVTSVAGRQVFAGSAPAGALAAPTVAGARSRSAGSRTATARTAPAAQSTLGDLYSDYQPGRAPSLLAASGAPSGGAGAGLGVGMLAFGLFSLVGGLTVAEARRRRTA